MTTLQARALARLPLTVEEVERLFQENRPIMNCTALGSVILDLCTSHERLRAELDGSAVVIADLEREVAELRKRLEEMPAD